MSKAREGLQMKNQRGCEWSLTCPQPRGGNRRKAPSHGWFKDQLDSESDVVSGETQWRACIRRGHFLSCLSCSRNCVDSVSESLCQKDVLFIAGAISGLAGKVQNVINISPNPVILERSPNCEDWSSSNKVIHIIYTNLILKSTNVNDSTESCVQFWNRLYCY